MRYIQECFDSDGMLQEGENDPRVPGALLKATVDPFEYGVGFRNGISFIFHEAEVVEIGQQLTAVLIHCEKFEQPPTFDRGVDVRCGGKWVHHERIKSHEAVASLKKHKTGLVLEAAGADFIVCNLNDIAWVCDAPHGS